LTILIKIEHTKNIDKDFQETMVKNGEDKTYIRLKEIIEKYFNDGYINALIDEEEKRREVPITQIPWCRQEISDTTYSVFYFVLIKSKKY